jgi:GNAT superfamily N-acetyltransferase
MLGVVVEAEDGQLVAMLGATVYEEYMSEDKFATDIVLYVHPDHRGGSIIVRLVKLYEDWALRNGVKPENTKLSVGTGVEVERTVRIFERLGYKLNSYNMVKDKANV